MSSCGSTDTSSPPAVPIRPAKINTSVKRKREQDFEHIIEEVEAIKDRESLSPETMAYAERLVTLAKSSNDDPDDPTGVELSFGMFRKIIKARKARHTDGESTRQRFLIHIGDWVACIVNKVRKYEDNAVDEVYKGELSKEAQKLDPELK